MVDIDEVSSQRLTILGSVDDESRRAASMMKQLIEEGEFGGVIRDETHGMLISHVVSAVARAIKGKPESDGPHADVFSEVVENAPGAIQQAERISQRLADMAHIELPESEIQFLAIHLATLQST